jgi:hypothetical protein
MDRLSNQVADSLAKRQKLSMDKVTERIAVLKDKFELASEQYIVSRLCLNDL